MEMGVLKPSELSRSQATSSTEAVRASDHATRQSNVPAVSLQAGGPGQTHERDRAQLDAAVSDIQDYVQSVSRDIAFAVDGDSGRMVVSITERSSGNVIRQIPSEEALRLAEHLADIRSLLFEAKA